MGVPLSFDSAQTDWTFSEFLSLLDLRGQTWCIVELRSKGAFEVSANEGILFYCVLQGAACLLSLPGGTLELNLGEVRMVLSGDSHTISVDPDNSAQVLEFLREYPDVESPPTFTIGFGPTKARVLCGKLKASWPSGLRRTSTPSSVKLDTDTLGSETTAARLEALQICAAGSGATALLTRFAAMIFALTLRRHPHFPALFRLSASSDPIAHALQLVRSNLATDWSVASLAHRVGMRRSSFAARFMAEVNRTPLDVITEHRMEYAADLLRRGKLKIREISACVGYHSEEAFSRRFTRFFGIAPSQMRREAQRRQKDDLKRELDGIASAVSTASGLSPSS